jgi:hypothetical protein
MVDDSVLRFALKCPSRSRVGRREVKRQIHSTNSCNDRFFEDDFLDCFRIVNSVIRNS